MTPEEAAAMDIRTRNALDIPPVVVRYAEQHPEDWAGFYLLRSGGGFVAQVTREVDTHRAALLALFPPNALSIEVKEVRWSTAELDAFNARLWTDEALAWLTDLGVAVSGGGARVQENDVRLTVKVPRSDATLAQRIVDHFGGREWLTVDVEIVPALALPFGDLEVTVVDAEGMPVAAVICKLVPTVVGAGGDQIFRTTDQAGVCRWEDTHATVYGVEVWRTVDRDLLGTGRVTVPPDGVGRLRIVLRVQ